MKRYHANSQFTCIYMRSSIGLGYYNILKYEFIKKITPKIQSVDRESHTVSLMFHDMQTTKGVDRVSHTMIWKGNESCVYTHTCQMSVGWQCLFVCEWLRRIEGRWEQIRSEPPCASLCMVSSTYIVQTNGWSMCGELNYPWRYVSFFGKLSMTKYSLLNSWGKEIGRGR